jgi:hypothetical protein
VVLVLVSKLKELVERIEQRMCDKPVEYFVLSSSHEIKIATYSICKWQFSLISI